MEKLRYESIANLDCEANTFERSLHGQFMSEEEMYIAGEWTSSENGDYNIKELPNALDRSKACSAFLLPVPGPKMIWMFGELGYDISIDENGRVGKKPILWDYYESNNRYRLYQIFSALINFLLSLWCKPIEGSSRTYKTPVNPEPICEAKRILCASPPDKVPDSLERVK